MFDVGSRLGGEGIAEFPEKGVDVWRAARAGGEVEKRQLGPRTNWGYEKELGFLAEGARSGFPFGPVWRAERAEGEYPTGGRYSVRKHICGYCRVVRWKWLACSFLTQGHEHQSMNVLSCLRPLHLIWSMDYVITSLFLESRLSKGILHM